MSASSSEVEVKPSTVLPMFSTEEQGLKVSISQLSSGPVPRGYLPGLVTINRAKESSSMGFAALEAGLAFYLDGGGRVSKLYACSPREDTDLQQHVCSIGFEALEESMSTIREEGVVKLVESNGLSLHENRLYSCRPEELRKHCEQRLAQNSNAADTLHDILGRLLHDAGNPKEAINSYTSALLVNPKSAAIFRNLGSAYHATGDMQLAFASYQQALQLDSTDILVYLKLAYLYEDLAGKDWPEAAEHAQKCYQFYLDKVDAEDTSVLTRLGNLLMKEHSYEEAAAVYKKALDIDPRLFNVWFNLAHSQVLQCPHRSQA